MVVPYVEPDGSTMPLDNEQGEYCEACAICGDLYSDGELPEDKVCLYCALESKR